MEIEGYSNIDVEKFFNQAKGNKDLIVWTWGAIEIITNLFPKSDHYIQEYKDTFRIAIGVKNKNSPKSNKNRHFLIKLSGMTARIVVCCPLFSIYGKSVLNGSC